MTRAIVYFVFLLLLSANAFAIPQLINYQGKLTDTGGSALDTTVAMTFKFYNGSGGGATLLWTELHSAVPVEDGLFNQVLGLNTLLSDAVFNNTEVWLGVTVGSNTEMVPRERLTAVSYSYRVGTVDGARGGTISGKLNVGSSNDNSGQSANVHGENNHARGNFSVIGGGGGPATSDSNSVLAEHGFIGGGAGNIVEQAHSAIAGGLNNDALGIRGFIGGGAYNSISADADWSVIGGGDQNIVTNDRAFIGGGSLNEAADFDAVVSGGLSNRASGLRSTISGGRNNLAGGEYAVVSGGDSNLIFSPYCTIGGGRRNFASNYYTTISGGHQNEASGWASVVSGGMLAEAHGDYAVIGGGYANQTQSQNSTVSGGAFNQAVSEGATVGGGEENIASGFFSTIAGGSRNEIEGSRSAIPGGVRIEIAGDSTFACGSNITASANNAFIFSDGAETFTPGLNNSANFLVTGGFRIWTASPTSSNIGTRLAAGGSSWIALSDSTLKTNRVRVNTAEVLQKVAALPVDQWNYKHQADGPLHIGPMAQDFYSAFRLGSDSLGIETIDADGILFVSVQELARQNSDFSIENKKQAADIAELQTLVQQLLQHSSK